MKTSIKKYFLIIMIINMVNISAAQDITLKGRSAIELNFGLWGGVEASNTVSGTGIKSVANTSGFTGGLGYTYWLREHLSLTLTAGLLSAQASSTVSLFNVTQQSSTVVPLLLGIRFYVPTPEPSDNLRPFISAAIGPYFGSEVKNTVLSQEARKETAFGGRLGAGFDFLLGNYFKLNAQADFNFMSDFNTTIGARKNYNGGDFSFGVGYIF
jgi:hypothetical protein